ncbi:MAG: hypothetical protein QM675_04175 [Protaetiibacter sp.]
MTLTDPQIWTLIGVFAAAMFGVLGLIVPLVNRNMAAGFAAVNTKIDSLEKVMNAKFEAVDAKFDAVYTKLDHLDRDVTAISKKVFDRPE